MDEGGNGSTFLFERTTAKRHRIKASVTQMKAITNPHLIPQRPSAKSRDSLPQMARTLSLSQPAGKHKIPITMLTPRKKRFIFLMGKNSIFTYLPCKPCRIEHISKTDWSFMTQKRSMATTTRILKSTAMPTKTVEARKAGLKMDEKLTRLPMHRTSGSLRTPSAFEVDLEQ